MAYAFYIKAISLYEQIVDIGRDQSNTEGALVALQDVVQRFPDTEYARDATLKIDLTNDHLAGKEMAVGRYYLKRGDYIGAINRFRTVVEQYQTTPQIAEALERSDRVPITAWAWTARPRPRPPCWGAIIPARAGTRTPITS